MHYHIIDCVHKHKNNLRGETQKWDGEEEEGQVLGLEEDHSAIYRHGKDLAGFTAEAHAGICTDPTRAAVPPIKPEDEATLLAEQKTLIEEQLKTMQETLKKIQERLNGLNK